MVATINGAAMCGKLQQDAKRQFIHRHTGDNTPAWARKEWKDGQPYPLQFADDADWLANTTFWVTTKGELARRPGYCKSRPTWPNNPELRKP